MVLPGTKPLDGEFWYVLDDRNNVDWRPRPKQRGDFYLGWLGQGKNVIGAGLARLKQGQLVHICTHGTPYYWLQPYEVLPVTGQVLLDQQMSGADAMAWDYSLGGWELRDQTPTRVHPWPDAPTIPMNKATLSQAVLVILRNARIDGEAPPPQVQGLLARTEQAPPPDPLQALLDRLCERLGKPNVLPILIELVKHDVNVMPAYRRSDLFENLMTDEVVPPPSKVARLVLSTVYHLSPLLNSQRLSSALLLNSLRQRHPFDVAWGTDFLVQCIGLANLVRLLQVAIVKEGDDQVRGNVLDLLQDLGYGLNAGLEGQVLSRLDKLAGQDSLGALTQVIHSHLSFLQEYVRQRDAAHPIR
jgi:hypothetical protein